MLATLTEKPFSNPHWIFECKLDGQRCLLYKKNNKIAIVSRNHKIQNTYYPEIVVALKNIPGNFILDSELVTLEHGISSFSKLQSRLHLINPSRELINKIPVHVYVFDVLYLDKYNLCHLPLYERKIILKNHFLFKAPIHYLNYEATAGVRYFQEACKKGWEGIIAKDKHSTYVQKRSKSWLKVKCNNGQEFVIGGYTLPKGRRSKFGALLLGFFQNNKFIYAGKVGTGFDEQMLTLIYNKLLNIKQKICPFYNFNEKTNEITWVEPHMIAEVRYTEWTITGKLRHPRFIGLRYDKNPYEIVREDKSVT